MAFRGLLCKKTIFHQKPTAKNNEMITTYYKAAMNKDYEVVEFN